MSRWGPDTFDSDRALDFIITEMDRHASAIERIFADSQRFRLDEDAEDELMPRIDILVLLTAHCYGVLDKTPGEVAAWRARYLEMYDDQIDEMAPTEEHKQQRRAVIEATFDELIRLRRKQEQYVQERWGM